MVTLSARDGAVHVDTGEEVLRIEPWGPDGIRVRGAPAAIDLDRAGGLLEAPPPSARPADIRVDDDGATIVNGRLKLVVRHSDLMTTAVTDSVHISFVRADAGAPLLEEEDPHPAWPRARRWRPSFHAGSAAGAGGHDTLPRLEVTFRAAAGEQLFGLGQYQHGRLAQKPGVHELEQQNMRVSVPFLLSSRGYGFLWNNPAVGRVELTEDRTHWVAEATPQLDYWVTAGDDPAEILRAAADATGHPAPMPDWGLGFWQSTLRYRSQQEVLDVVREHVVTRGLPLSVIVIDALHWRHHGDWAFDERDWPDPTTMTTALAGLGVRVMVSTWPLVNPASPSYPPLQAIDGFATLPDGSPAGTTFVEANQEAWVRLSLIDNSRRDVRALVFDRMREGYLDRGVAAIWLDGCEPETIPNEPEAISYAAGPGLAVTNQFPREQARLVAEGMWASGRHDVVTLARSAWIGSQRYGVVLWSGDVRSTWDDLRRQVPAGLNVSLAGIPWWTTDIGGFHGGTPADEAYRELFIRWFQYGTFCPVFRLHGFREPALGIAGPGGPNQVWSYGDRAYPILVEHLRLRERLRPYLRRLADEATRTGLPPMRPPFVDFPEDPAAWTIDDAFMLGPDLYVAPVLEPGVASRRVRLPAGARWVELATDMTHDGGTEVDAAAPIERIPLFVREGAVDPFGGRA